MKTYRMEKNPYTLGICNFERKDESKIFSDLIERLKNEANVVLGEKKEFAYCEILTGSCEKGEFNIIYDFSYGTEIMGKNSNVLNYLEKAINN